MGLFPKKGKKVPREIPKPSGSYNVGCTDIMTGYSADGVFMRLFYPTLPTKNATSPVWLPHESYLKGYAMFFKMWPPLFCKSFPKFVGDIHTPAAWDVPPLRLPGHRFPVIVFSHGLGACRTTYTTFCLEFASRGFIVAALEHRDYSACMSYYFERQMSTKDKKTGDLDSPPNLVKHWMLLKKVKSGKGEFSIRNQQVHQRAKECIAALDLLHALHKGEQVDNIMDTSHLPLNSFNDIFDMDRISIAGHSFGGATVITTMAKDKRFKAGLGLDTWMVPLKEETSIFQQVNQPMLFINMEKFQTKENLRVMKLMESIDIQRIIITLKETVHLNQCDVPFLCDKTMRKLFGAHSKLDRFTAMNLTTNLSNVFLSKHLGK
ncbi:platelet-activating factor acetylhydrolase [Trichonephila inaurata madagascariensis]|uniref:1-alkyl-2-acetylglycerophosphocholine esterase n=1 Tax=Trichonephila inaurata madagascariensis TaxID=2747483 RepID=A0A8X6WVZ1_9ARAC|nr:platelet-activating factor acetylhydrolase [Trichonephila inaurata madagascariensis]